MTTNVIPMFAYGAQQLRGVMIDGQPWFVATDACACVGLTLNGGTTQHTARLDRDEKLTVWKGVRGKTLYPQVAHVFGKFDSVLTLVSRPGLFKLIQRSSKPEAKAFDRCSRGCSTRQHPLRTTGDIDDKTNIRRTDVGAHPT